MITLLKNNIVPLIFVFLFSYQKAESNNSAFCGYNSLQQSNSTNLLVKKYLLAEKLYKSKDYVKALKYSYSILENPILDEYTKTKTTVLIGNIFKETKYVNKAIANYKKGLILIKKNKKELKKTAQKEEIEKLEAEVFLRIGVLQSKIKKDSSIYYLTKLLNLSSVNKDVLIFKGDAHTTLSAIYSYGNKDLTLAKKHALEAITIHSNFDKKVTLAADYGNLAGIYAENKEYKEAKKLYLKALTYLKDEFSSEAVEYKELLYDNLAWTLYNLRDYKAYDYLDMSHEIKDSINNQKFTTELKKIDLKHNINRIKEEEENKRLEAESKTWFIGVLGVTVSLLLLYLANLYKLRQRNLNLQLSKKELEQQRKLDEVKSEAQVKIINATIDGKETERKQIAEILHDNVSALLSSANLHLQARQKQFKGKPPVELEKTQQIILEASQKIRDLSHHLVSSVLLKFGLEFAVKDMAKKYSNSELKIHTAIGEVDRYAQESEIKIFNIIQELVNNILKHSKAKNAYIMIEEVEGSLSVIVKDDGIGFNKDKIVEGIGLNQIQARIYMMKGSFLIEGTKAKGTKVTINVPVTKRNKEW